MKNLKPLFWAGHFVNEGVILVKYGTSWTKRSVMSFKIDYAVARLYLHFLNS